MSARKSNELAEIDESLHSIDKAAGLGTALQFVNAVLALCTVVSEIRSCIGGQHRSGR
jgi:hypothetical protein